MTLREIIINKRLELKLTQGEVAEKAGISQPRISEFESGRREMNSANIDKVLNVLGITFDTYERSYLVIYQNMNIITKTGKRRTEEFIKSVFWNEVPENWQHFDGEISIRSHEPFGIRDTAIVVFYSKYWEKLILDKMYKDGDIYKVEPMF